jgi:WD40 repeat protein
LNNNHDGIDLPTSIIVELLPFLDRETWNNVILTNRAIYQASTLIEPPWPRRKFSVGEHEHKLVLILHMTFSSDGKYFFVKTLCRGIYVWHKRIGPYAVLYHTAARAARRTFQIKSMASSPTENLLVTVSCDEVGAILQFLDIPSLSVVNEVFISDAALNVCVFSPDGRLVACGGNVYASLHIYSASNAVRIKTITPNAYGWHTFGGFSPDSQTIVAGVHGRVVRVWDVAGGDDTAFDDISPRVKRSEFTNGPDRLPFSPQGQSFIIGTASVNVCKLAEYQNSMWVVKDLQLSMEVNGLYFFFSPGGRLLAARQIDGIMALWDPVAGTMVQTLGQCQDPKFLAFSGDGKMLAVLDEFSHVYLWPVVI